MMDTASENKNPLVSIIVITYNSAKYVLETLESAKAQTYQNIELIVSDDCSTDDTMAICKKWLLKNKNRFIHTKLIESDLNTGVSSNCNRGIHYSNGVWIKFIAGDDFLLPNCIVDNIEFAKKRRAEFICSKMKILEGEKIYNREYDDLQKIINTYSQKNKIKQTLKLNFIPTPSVFIKRELLLKNKGFDESIPMIEDTPMWLKLLINGTVFYFLNEYTVVYRNNLGSLSGFEKSINKKYFESNKIFYKSIKRKMLLSYRMYTYYMHYLIMFKYWDLVIKKGNDAENLCFWEKCIKLLDPLWWKIKFKTFFG